MRRRRGLIQHEGGATAVEFALLAPLFFVFILAIVDISTYYFVAGQLQHAVGQAARQIRTGQLSGNNTTTRDTFRTLICDNIQTGLVGNCTSKVLVDVRAFNNFGAITLPASLDANNDGTIQDTETSFNSGGPSCPVIARVFFKFTTLVPGLQRLLTSVVPGTVYITSATAFRNEPFSGGTSPACP